MAEALPSLRCRVYADYTEGGDLGGGSNNTWVNEEGGSAQERCYIKYDFVTSSGYSDRGEDCSVEGQAIHFDYDLSKSVYANKRQFVLGAYAYVLSKNLDYSGMLPSGDVVAFLTGTGTPEPKKLLRAMQYYDEYTVTDRPFDSMETNAYNRVSQLYLYPQPGIEATGFYADNAYTVDAEVVLCGVKGAYPPYLDVVAEDVVPSVADVQPNGTFVDKNDDIRLSWNLSYEDIRYATFEGIDSPTAIGGRVFGEITQKNALVRWTEDGGSTIHEITVGTENACVIPAGSVTADSFQWQVKVCTQDGIWSEDDGVWYTATTDNDSLSTAVAVRPQRIVIDGTGENTFVWEHENPSGSKPTGADLQWSADGKSGWTTFLEYRGRESQCVVPPDSLPAGAIFWRVRTYNASGVAGSWSEGVPLTVRNAPAMPEIVSVGETPLPEIRWGAEEQYVAEIVIDGLCKRVYGSAKTYQWPEILEAGSHSLKLRVQNQYGLWSQWAEMTVETVNQPRESFLLSGEEVAFGVRLSWTEAFPQVQVFRNGERIAKLENQEREFTDWNSVKEAQYQLRGIDENGSYTDSNVVSLAPVIRGAGLGQNGVWIGLKGRYKAAPIHRFHTEKRLHYRNFSGFSLPVAFAGSHWEKVHRFVFSLEAGEVEKLEKIKSFSGGRVVYKDCRGSMVCGVFGAVESIHYGRYLDVEFSITEAAEGGES